MVEIGHPDLRLWTRPAAFPAREKVQTSNGLPSSLSRDVAPALVFDRVCHPSDFLLRCPVPIRGRPSSPPFSSARQIKAVRSYSGTGAAALTVCLGFPSPHRTRFAGLRCGSGHAVVAERRRGVPPSLAIQFSRCRGDKRFCQIQLDRTAAPVLDCLQQISYRLSNRCQYNIKIEPCQDRAYLKIY